MKTKTTKRSITSLTRKPFDVVKVFSRVIEHCAPGRVTWTGIKDYDASIGNTLTPAQKLELHRQIFKQND